MYHKSNSTNYCEDLDSSDSDFTGGEFAKKNKVVEINRGDRNEKETANSQRGKMYRRGR